jgi:hypothetical protein
VKLFLNIYNYFSGKPQFTNSLNNISIFYEVGKNHYVDCYVEGYPLPNVSWAFKKCLNYPNCTDAYTFNDLTVN